MSTTINYTLEITVLPIDPKVWRRILVPSDISLSRLHAILQIATGASGSLQRFFIDNHKRIFGHPTWKDFPKIKSDARVRLDRLLLRPGDSLAYYAGEEDEWEHVVQLLKVTVSAMRLHRATCLAGDGHRGGRYERAAGLFRRSAVNQTLSQVMV